MSLDTDAIRELVASKHGISLSKDDPLLSLLAVNDIVLQQHSQVLSEQVNHVRDHVDAVTLQYQQQCKDLADGIVGQSLQKIQAAGEEIRQGLQDVLAAERVQRKEEATALIAHLRGLRNQALIAGFVSGFGALFEIMLTMVWLYQ